METCIHRGIKSEVYLIKNGTIIEKCFYDEEQLLREVEVLKRLDGLSFVPKYIEHNSYCVRMTYINGKTLAQLIDEEPDTPFPEELIWNIYHSLIKNYQILTMFNIYHCDLCSLNLIWYNDEVHFIDFAESRDEPRTGFNKAVCNLLYELMNRETLITLHANKGFRFKYSDELVKLCTGLFS